MPDELVALAEAGAQAFVVAMASDAWSTLRVRFAHLLKTEEQVLDVSRQRYAQQAEADRPAVAEQYRADAAARLVDVMRQDPTVAMELRALLAQFGSAAGSPPLPSSRSTAPTSSVQFGRGNRATQQTAGRTAIHVEGNYIKKRTFLGMPLAIAVGVGILLAGGGSGIIVAAASGQGGPSGEDFYFVRSPGVFASIEWAADSSGDINGDFRVIDLADSSQDSDSVFTGAQRGNNVTFIFTDNGQESEVDGFISGNVLTFELLTDAPADSLKWQRTTPTQFEDMVVAYASAHPNPNASS